MNNTPPQTDQAVMIGIGEYRIGTFRMASIGLGSCIGLTLFDPEKKIGAMVHIMLPESSGRTDRPGKYADTAIPLLINELTVNGSKKKSLVAKIAGGATMFEAFSASMNIGQRNIEKVKDLLAEHNIRIAADDTGGKMGRSVYFVPYENGRVTVRLANGSSRDI
ncbi:MAG: Chemoreceptor glutamine deamidase CheD [Methanoregula sp. PtaU1.Bin051]|nr:MAG: Chemoreceptor glutamine deamidase CheD [Methanoregula sp. PtaU1.Bin051]